MARNRNNSNGTPNPNQQNQGPNHYSPRQALDGKVDFNQLIDDKFNLKVGAATNPTAKEKRKFKDDASSEIADLYQPYQDVLDPVFASAHNANAVMGTVGYGRPLTNTGEIDTIIPGAKEIVKAAAKDINADKKPSKRKRDFLDAMGHRAAALQVEADPSAINESDFNSSGEYVDAKRKAVNELIAQKQADFLTASRMGNADLMHKHREDLADLRSYAWIFNQKDSHGNARPPFVNIYAARDFINADKTSNTAEKAEMDRQAHQDRVFAKYDGPIKAMMRGQRDQDTQKWLDAEGQYEADLATKIGDAREKLGLEYGTRQRKLGGGNTPEFQQLRADYDKLVQESIAHDLDKLSRSGQLPGTKAEVIKLIADKTLDFGHQLETTTRDHYKQDKSWHSKLRTRVMNFMSGRDSEGNMQTGWKKWRGRILGAGLVAGGIALGGPLGVLMAAGASGTSLYSSLETKAREKRLGRGMDDQLASHDDITKNIENSAFGIGLTSNASNLDWNRTFNMSNMGQSADNEAKEKDTGKQQKRRVMRVGAAAVAAGLAGTGAIYGKSVIGMGIDALDPYLPDMPNMNWDMSFNQEMKGNFVDHGGGSGGGNSAQFVSNTPGDIYVDPGHGFSHEIQEFGALHGHPVDSDTAYQIYDQLEKEFGGKILGGDGSSYTMPQYGGDYGISSPGWKKLNPEALARLNELLNLQR